METKEQLIRTALETAYNKLIERANRETTTYTETYNIEGFSVADVVELAKEHNITDSAFVSVVYEDNTDGECGAILCVEKKRLLTETEKYNFCAQIALSPFFRYILNALKPLMAENGYKYISSPNNDRYRKLMVNGIYRDLYKHYINGNISEIVEFLSFNYVKE